MPDGLYGDEEGLLQSFINGREQQAWDRAIACNAVSDEAKIKCWLTSDGYDSRQAGIADDTYST